MKRIFWQSCIVTVFSIAASVAMTATVVPALGGTFGPHSLLMSVLCPLVLAGPCSAYTFWQKENLSRALCEVEHAHAELARAHRILAEQARRDTMTGMLNREGFFSALEEARGSAMPGALLIIDADHFKQINDRYGHLTGDEALLQIAAAIRRGVRGDDILGRIGGEEFAVFLNAADEHESAAVAERIRREVELIRFQVEGQSVPLTVSIGGTACRNGSRLSDLMRAADKRLYEAKQAGRNRAILDIWKAAA